MVDVIRACYTAKMQFYFDSSETVDVEWYPAKDDAKDMPFASSFCSRQWEDKDQIQPPLGELYTPKKWRNGKAPYACPKCGLTGTEEQWQEGSAVDDPLPECYDGTNIPKGCCPPPPIGFGGIAYSGTCEYPLSPGGGIAYGGSVGLPAGSLGGLGWGGTAFVRRDDMGGMAWGGNARFPIPIYDGSPPDCSSCN